ncbi:MAG TPA: sigma-70 family RNA polymerase sigma factor [Streptosporangiaceae bacterium]|nr:sigma-70 family RNA polymerase sigma factor [Streptosporangiaceae bacterium]
MPRLTGMNPDLAVAVAGADPESAVTALYRDHALTLIRLAHIMVGNHAAAEDIVQDAFCGLYRRWEHLANKDKALGYLRSSVLNGCRSALRAAGRHRDLLIAEGYGDLAGVLDSAEARVLTSERRQAIVAALRALPGRQRDVLVLRYFLGIDDDEIARDLEMNPSTIRSSRRRGLAALRRTLKERP